MISGDTIMDQLGKKAEEKIKDWLNHAELGYSFDRVPDQLTGYYGSSNICDFMCYKYPNQYYIESKATEHDRFDFAMLTDIQYNGLLSKSGIPGAYGLVIVLFATYKRAFILDIRDIQKSIDNGQKSVNIKKCDAWTIPSVEIPTIPNNRKKLLDYTGELQYLVSILDLQHNMKGDGDEALHKSYDQQVI